jgi:N-dimethylarginine dimethylaminohydrolase
MEGGDVLWIDEETVAIGRGYRTTQGAIDKFIELTKDVVKEHFVVPMPHADGREACLHLMSIISFVDVDKAVVYSRYMPIIFREFLINRGITLIEIGDEEYERLGSNVLALAPGKCVMIEDCPEIQQKIEDAGVEVKTYPGPELSFKGTGGPTCLTCPVFR